MKVDDLNKTLTGSIKSPSSTTPAFKLREENSEKAQKDNNILEATKKFEGMFLQHLMNEMMKSTGDFMGKGLSGDIFKGLFVQKMSEQLTEGKGIGLSDMVYAYFEKTGLTDKPNQLIEKNE